MKCLLSGSEFFILRWILYISAIWFRFWWLQMCHQEPRRGSNCNSQN